MRAWVQGKFQNYNKTGYRNQSKLSKTARASKTESVLLPVNYTAKQKDAISSQIVKRYRCPGHLRKDGTLGVCQLNERTLEPSVYYDLLLVDQLGEDLFGKNIVIRCVKCNALSNDARNDLLGDAKYVKMHPQPKLDRYLK